MTLSFYTFAILRMRPVVGPRDDSYTGICLFSLIAYETRLSASASVVGVQRLG